MTKSQITIDGITYTKSSLTAVCRNIICESKGGKDLTDHAKQVAVWVYEQRRGEKPTAHVRFRISAEGCYSGFIYSEDNWKTLENLSFKKALMSDCGERKHKILCAFRWAVYTQIKEFRVKQLSLPCNQHLKALANINSYNVHTDHVVPLHFLLSDFLQGRGLTIFDVKVREKRGYVGEYELVDKELKASWQDFHREHAKLKLLTKEESFEKGRSYDLALYRFNKTRQRSYDFNQVTQN